MSHQLGRLISEILNRHFGNIVQQVGNDLFTYGSKPIVMIVKTTALPRVQVVESLRTLLKYDLATFEQSKNESVADYKLNADNVLLLIRYPRYLFQIKSKYGNEAELLVEDVLQSGIVTPTGLLLGIAKKYKDDKEKNISIVSLKDTFISLATAGYFQQAAVPEIKDGNFDVPILTPVVSIVPEIDTRGLIQALASGDSSHIESNVYWKVNFDRFHQDFRDEIMIQAMCRLIDENAGELMRQLLNLMYLRTGPWAPVSNPVPVLELRDSTKRTSTQNPLLHQHLDQYLKVLEENGSGFIRRSGDASCGQYTVNMRHAATQALWQLLDHTITEKLGSKAARIFRLVRSKKYIEEDDIQKHAMLPNKECKQLTYKLMEEHFITVQPMRKAASGGSVAKAIYLYHINMHEVAHTALEMCHRALHNVWRRAGHERGGHARLLDKRRRVDSIVHGMRVRGETGENIDDIEETITPPERLLLQDVERRLKQLSTAEIELDKSLFILQWYFMYKPR